MKEILTAIPEGKRAELEKDTHPITERIKTIEDAEKELAEWAASGDKMAARLLNDFGSLHISTSLHLIAYVKLCIIAAALNEKWERQFAYCEPRYFPSFRYCTEKELKRKSNYCPIQ